MLPNHFNSVPLDKLQLTEAEVTMQWVGLVQSCSLVIAVIALKLAPPTPLATILSSNDDIVVTINWPSLRTCVKFVSLIQNRKGSRIISFVFWRNGQWDRYQKCKKNNYRCQYLVRGLWDTYLWYFWCWWSILQKRYSIEESKRLLHQTRQDHQRPEHIRLMTVQQPNCLSIPIIKHH